MPRRPAALLAPALAVVAVACKPTVDDVYAALPAEGAPVPAFRYAGLRGETLDPAALRGAPAVVALWSSTCSASRLALGALGALHAAYAPRGVRVVILADDRDRAAVDPLLARSGVGAPVALATGTLLGTFTHGQSPLPWRKAFALPTFLVLDAEGGVVYRQVGVELDPAAQLERVRARLDGLLRDTPTGGPGAPAA